MDKGKSPDFYNQPSHEEIKQFTREITDQITSSYQIQLSLIKALLGEDLFLQALEDIKRHEAAIDDINQKDTDAIQTFAAAESSIETQIGDAYCMLGHMRQPIDVLIGEDYIEIDTRTAERPINQEEVVAYNPLLLLTLHTGELRLNRETVQTRQQIDAIKAVLAHVPAALQHVAESILAPPTE